MNILQVIPFFSPIFGGSAIVPYNLSQELAKRGHHVTIFTSNSKVSQEWIDSSPNIEVFPFKTRLNMKELYITPSMRKYAKEGLKDLDVIHLHNYRTFQNIVVQYYAKKYCVPYVLQAHGSLPRIMTKQRLKWIYDVLFGNRLLRNASKVIAVNPVEAQQYRHVGVPKEKIKVVPNGILLSEYDHLPSKGLFKKKYGLGENEKIVLYLGRIHRIKGIDVLVKAFALVRETFDDVKLVIVGPDDGYLSEIQVLIKRLAMEKDILITGPLYDNEKIEAYVDADICVLPSRYEIWGLTVLEANACRKPVVATRIGGLENLVIDHYTGLLFDPENENQLAASISVLLDDQNFASLMGAQGQKFVEQSFSIERITDRVVKLYREIAI